MGHNKKKFQNVECDIEFSEYMNIMLFLIILRVEKDFMNIMNLIDSMNFMTKRAS